MKKSIIFATAALLISAVSCGRSQRSKDAVFVPDSLLIVSGQRVGNRVIDRKGDCYILCIKTDGGRFAGVMNRSRQPLRWRPPVLFVTMPKIF